MSETLTVQCGSSVARAVRTFTAAAPHAKDAPFVSDRIKEYPDGVVIVELPFHCVSSVITSDVCVLGSTMPGSTVVDVSTLA
jgi:hypothetical protein